MAMLKMPGDLDTPSVRPPASARPGDSEDQFSPVRAARIRYRRGATWSASAGAGDPDYSKLRFMRVMERQNCG
ncbi:MAG TPA: hypothetical protein VGP93_05630 [Polyangiaceae bacterium]|nr:hypothetical protein [Polyangiaceae bacterium]